MEQIRVSSSSLPSKVAGALSGLLRVQDSVQIQVIGAASLNQAIKSIAIARGYIAPTGKDIYCIPAFSDILIEGEDRTAIKLIVKAF